MKKLASRGRIAAAILTAAIALGAVAPAAAPVVSANTWIHPVHSRVQWQ